MIKNRRINPLAADLLWLMLPATIAIWIAVMIGWNFPDRAVNIHLLDTFYTITIELFLLPLFLLFSFLLFLIKEYWKGFSRVLPNWIIIISGVSWVFILSYLIFLLPQIFGFTDAQDLKYVLTALQILFIAVLLYVMYKWGKSRAR